MNNTIITTKDFESSFKRLLKKYPSLDRDYEILLENLVKNPDMGEKLGGNVRKVRMSMHRKAKENISSKEIEILKRRNGL